MCLVEINFVVVRLKQKCLGLHWMCVNNGTKEKEASKKLEKELLMYKREVVEQHEKGFHNTIRQVGFIAKDRDLSHFYLFKDVKDSVMLDEEDIVVEGEVVRKMGNFYISFNIVVCLD